MHLLLELASFIAVPVLVLHMVIDLVDKHRHGFKIHDKVSILAYVVLAIHFAIDLHELF